MNAEDTKLDRLIRTIRALRAKADGTNNEHEAEAFSAKVQALMAEYGLEESALRVEDQDEIDSETLVASWSPTKRQMINACTRLYMCRIIMMGGGRWTLVGRRHNMAITREMMDYLVRATNRLSKSYSRISKDQVDFRKGCYLRLAERLTELRSMQTRQTAVFTPQGNPGNLPALYKTEGQLTQDKVSALFGKTQSVRGRSIKVGEHSAHGRAAAEGISLNSQIGGRGSSVRLLGSK
jgi:Protein of unknown function (DUF2786)